MAAEWGNHEYDLWFKNGEMEATGFYRVKTFESVMRWVRQAKTDEVRAVYRVYDRHREKHQLAGPHRVAIYSSESGWIQDSLEEHEKAVLKGQEFHPARRR